MRCRPFPGSYITGCVEKADNAFDFTMGAGKPNKKLEGHYFLYEYNYPKTASKVQIVRNLNTALHNAGYTFDYDSGDYGDFTVHMGGTWLHVCFGRVKEDAVDHNVAAGGKTGGERGGVGYHILCERRLLDDGLLVTASAADLDLKPRAAHVDNGILFDTAKADVKPESGPAIEQVAKMLTQDPKLKVYVVGHTDNVGTLAGNLDLSKRRAAAVVQVLVSQYHVAADRLAPFGAASYAPIQSNDTESGRALNRRVELVKQ